MKEIRLLTIAMATMLLATSCGGSSDGNNEEQNKLAESVTVKPSQTEVKGDLKGCFEVVDRSYDATVDIVYDYVLSVELKRTSNELPYDRDNVAGFDKMGDGSTEYCAGFGLELLDANGGVVDVKAVNSYNSYSDDQISVLRLLPDDTAIARFKIDSDKMAKAVSFRVISSLMPNKKDKKDDTHASADVDVPTTGGDISSTEVPDVDVTMEDALNAVDAANRAMDAGIKVLDAVNSMYN